MPKLECQYFIHVNEKTGKITLTGRCFKGQNGKAKLRDLEIHGQQIALCNHHYYKVTGGFDK
jgi:hypothetical protein